MNRRDGGSGPLRGLGDRWALVSLATLVFWAASQALRPMLVLRLDELGTDPASIGWIVATYPLVALVLAIPGGRLVDRIGTTLTLVAGVVAMVASGVGYALAASVPALVLAQMVNGLAEMLVWLALQTIISHAGTGEFLTRRLASFSLAWGIGTAAGPIAGAWILSAQGFGFLGWSYGGAAVLVLVALLTPRPEPADDPGEARERTSFGASIHGMVANPAVFNVLLSTFIALYLNSVRTSFYPLFLTSDGVPVQQVGVLLAVTGIASIVIRVPIPYLMRRIGPGWLLIAGMWMSLVPLALTPWLPGFGLLCLAAVLIGLGYGVNAPVTVQLMVQHTARNERGQAMGLRVTSNRLAQVLQPLIFGALVSSVGIGSAFAVSGGLLGALALWAGHAVRRLRTGSTDA